jgi:hypothetical protein
MDSQWYLDAVEEADHVFHQALANGATKDEAARLSKKTFGRLRGKAADEGFPDAIEAQAAWVAKLKRKASS